MSASAPRPALTQDAAASQTRGFLHIVRYGNGPRAVYVLTYHRLDRVGVRPKPLLAEGAQPFEKALLDFSRFALSCGRGARGPNKSQAWC